MNFTVNLLKYDTQNRLMERFYACRRFEVVHHNPELDEIIMIGLSNPEDDAVARIGPMGDYHATFITNSNGKTIYSLR